MNRRVVFVGGCSRGCGGSTVASLLALAIAGDGRRTLLVDRVSPPGPLAELLGIGKEAAHGAATFAGPVTISDTLSLLGADEAPDFGSLADFDAVIIDAGSRLDTIEAAASIAAGRFIVTAGARPASLASAYALVKTIHMRWPASPMEILINKHDAVPAQQAFHRVRQAAQQFLGREVRLAGTIPEDDGLRSGILAGHSLTQLTARTRAGHAAQVVAARLMDELDGAAPHSASRTNERRH